MVGIMASNGEALIMGLSLPTFYKPLAFSGVTSNTRRAALTRYLETARHVYHLWYRGEPWEEGDPANQSLKTVNKMHKYISDMIRTAGEDFVEKVNGAFNDLLPEGDQARVLNDEL